jgi:glycosyltransferase involved in cell wall biosynthesis
VVLLGTIPTPNCPPGTRQRTSRVPSIKEGRGLAVLEAMAVGLPLVTSDLPVFRKYLSPGQDAPLVPVDDPPALAPVLDDPRLADQLRSPAPATCERFSWTRSAAEHQALYAALTR